MHSKKSLNLIAQFLLLIFSWLVWTSNSLRGVNGSELVQVNDCTCLGYTQTFECTVCGIGSTIWNGTFFDCDDKIQLRHSEYNRIKDDVDPDSLGPPSGECNQRAVSAKSIGIFDECYTSQLFVTVGEEMINGTIECIHDNFIERAVVSQKSLMITETPFPPPGNIHIESNDSHQITFAWDEVTVQCSCLQYIITVINCGVCPNTTADKNITCDMQSDISPHTKFNNTCLFAIQTEICGYLRGRRSEYVTVDISAHESDDSDLEPIPNPPIFKLNFHYSSKNITVEITFADEAVHDNIERPPVVSYTITYADVSSGGICGSATIPASSCMDGMCCHSFDEISPPCSSDGDISISVFSTGIFRDGLPSKPLVFCLRTPGNKLAFNSGRGTEELVLPITAAGLGSALVLVIAVFIVTVIKLQRDKANMKMLIKSLTVQSSVGITVKGDVNKGDYENIEICEQKVPTKTADIEVNKNPAYSTIKL